MKVRFHEPSTDVLGWKAWYTNKRFYTSRETRWVDLPTFGVLVVMLYFGGVYRRVMASTEHYTSDGERYNHANAPLTWGSVKRAPKKLIEQTEFDRLYDVAMTDMEMP